MHLQLYHLGLGTALNFGRAFALKGLAASGAKNHEIQAWPIMLRIWAMTCQAWSGLPKNLLQGEDRCSMGSIAPTPG
jgi:hypothetical protein